MSVLDLHLVRVGAMGQVGRFRAVDARTYERGKRVIVRTARGLELGEVLLGPPVGQGRVLSDGPLLRGVTHEDELLELRLAKHKHEAFEACAARIAELGLPAVLMDVEHLFDGRTLVFYFLGEQPPELQGLMDELAERYESKVQFRKFAEMLSEGCGPGCGTESATGGGCGSCATGCAVASACGVRGH